MAIDIAYHREAGMAARVIERFARRERKEELQKLEDLLAARGTALPAIQSAYENYQSAYGEWRQHLRNFAGELDRLLDGEAWPDDALRSRIDELVRRSHKDEELPQSIRKSREYFRTHFGTEATASAERDTALDDFVSSARETAKAGRARVESAHQRLAEAVNGNVSGKGGSGEDQLEKLLYMAQPFAAVWREELAAVAKRRNAAARPERRRNEVRGDAVRNAAPPGPQFAPEEQEAVSRRRAAPTPAGGGRGTAATPIPPAGSPPDEKVDPARCALDMNLTGLALSGGGIRSATLNLGILQVLAKYQHLHDLDYLSTVSGGGYIGAWLTAWIKRRGANEVYDALGASGGRPDDRRLRPIQFLRDYTSYLTPQAGAFSADTWTMAAVWARNTVLNLIILLSGLCALLLVPRLVGSGLHYYEIAAFEEKWKVLFWTVPPSITPVLTGLGALATLFFGLYFLRRPVRCIAKNLGEFADPGITPPGRNETPGFGDGQTKVIREVVAPVFGSALVCSCALWMLIRAAILWKPYFPWLSRPVVAAVVFVMGSAFFGVLLWLLQERGGFVDCYLKQTRRTNLDREYATVLLWLLPALSGILGGCFITALTWLFWDWSESPDSGLWQVATWGMPLFMQVFALTVVLHIGLMGRNFPDDRREWWSRIGAWTGIFSVAWMALAFVSVYGPLAAAKMAYWSGTVAAGAGGSWVALTVAGLLAGRSPKTGGVAKRNGSATLSLIATAAPYVFIAGLFLGLAVFLQTLLPRIQALVGGTSRFCSGAAATGPLKVYCDALAGRGSVTWGMLAYVHWPLLNAVSNILAGGVLLFFVVVMVGFARTVDINEFSMHHFYRNRLVRAYLGASHYPARKPNRFTGFDENDNVLLALCQQEPEPGILDDNLREYDGPYPILNTSLNLVHGDRLSWQERKAASFVMTPRYCGYEYQALPGVYAEPPLREYGYRPTVLYAYRDGGCHLGTAVAISGAAASPNAGYHSSPPLGFLLTVFNARLGWWLGNPRHDEGWTFPGPKLGLMYLVRELFGLTNDQSEFVYLSDGGHFENLGIYELIRRRCRLIVACDAEEDHAFGFGGLGGVIRKCDVDFNVKISIDVNRIRPLSVDQFCPAHCAIGTIVYPETDASGRQETGMLVYLKSSMTGDEPTDIREYRSRYEQFPHQSTADQFFNESQFESYRKLGQHIAEQVFNPARGLLLSQRTWGRADIADQLEDFTGKLEAIMSDLASDLSAAQARADLEPRILNTIR
ncbi:MAG TPA: hypothetical protein VLW65_21905 [Bryobacteraceae bacterium]|nr:hypothetical protein [Bryobacteraceae bacterium]